MRKIEAVHSERAGTHSPGLQPGGVPIAHDYAIAPAKTDTDAFLAKDFLTGCATLLTVALIVFVVLPAILIVAEVSVHVAAPLAILAVALFLVAMLGRAVRIVRTRW
jgi:hypothetical protein